MPACTMIFSRALQVAIFDLFVFHREKTIRSSIPLVEVKRDTRVPLVLYFPLYNFNMMNG